MSNDPELRGIKQLPVWAYSLNFLVNVKAVFISQPPVVSCLTHNDIALQSGDEALFYSRMGLHKGLLYPLLIVSRSAVLTEGLCGFCTVIYFLANSYRCTFQLIPPFCASCVPLTCRIALPSAVAMSSWHRPVS